MKITKKYLQKILKEEIEKTIQEQGAAGTQLPPLPGEPAEWPIARIELMASAIAEKLGVLDNSPMSYRNDRFFHAEHLLFAVCVKLGIPHHKFNFGAPERTPAEQALHDFRYERGPDDGTADDSDLDLRPRAPLPARPAIAPAPGTPTPSPFRRK